jgi:aminopeptidase YwaD
MAETHGLAARVVRAVADQELTYVRMGRFGDQSFLGLGVSSIFVELSQQIADPEPESLRGDAARSPWWWHTIDDTFDKVDGDRLLRDARIYAQVVWELATTSVLPFDFARTAAEVEEQLRAVAEKVGNHLSLDEALDVARELQERLERWNHDSVGDDPAAAIVRNDKLRLLGRHLIPILYSDVAPHEQSLADPIVGPLPGLLRALELRTVPQGSDTYQLLLVTMLRERNRVRLALDQALSLVKD